VDPAQPNLIQCDECRTDEKIDPSQVTEYELDYERKRFEELRPKLLSWNELVALFTANGLGDDRQFYARAGAIPKLRAYEELYFYRERAEEWVQDFLGTRSKIANERSKAKFCRTLLGDDFKPL
jgi:hypothetical protein